MPGVSDPIPDWWVYGGVPAWVRWAYSARDGQVHAFPLPAVRVVGNGAGPGNRHHRVPMPGLGARLLARFARNHRSREQQNPLEPSAPCPQFPVITRSRWSSLPCCALTCPSTCSGATARLRY
jgi:hypothetical protein